MIILFYHYSIEIQYKHLLTLWKNRNWHVKQALSSTEAFTTLKILRKPGAEEVRTIHESVYETYYETLCAILIPFVQFQKREKHPWRTITFSRVADLVTQIVHPPYLILRSLLFE